MSRRIHGSNLSGSRRPERRRQAAMYASWVASWARSLSLRMSRAIA
jgi:hypothetical protein